MAYSWTFGTISAGSAIKSSYLQEIKNNIITENNKRGITTNSYKVPVPGDVAQASDIQNLRNSLYWSINNVYTDNPAQAGVTFIKAVNINELRAHLDYLQTFYRTYPGSSCVSACQGLCASCYGTCEGGCGGACSHSCTSCSGSCSGCGSIWC